MELIPQGKELIVSHYLGREDGYDLSGQDRLAMYPCHPWLTLDLGFFLSQL